MRKLFAIVFVISVVFACKSPKEELIAEIVKLENSDSAFSINQITDLYIAYSSFANKYPDDEHTPEYLFKAAQQCNVLNKADEGILLFEKLIANYPKSKFCEQALFSIAFSYENNKNDFVNARKYYERFMQKYPQSELVEDAQLSIENLGKTDEEFLNSINRDSVVD